jgi:hypothetical protein
MGRLALAAAGLAVAALIGLLIVKSRPSAEDAGDGPDSRTSAAGRPIEGQRPEPALPARAGADRSPLPTPAEQAEARARVAAERVRPAHMSPDLIVDHKLKVKPMRDARKAYQRGEYELALARSQDALAVEPGSMSARVLATLSACGLGRVAVAQAHASELDSMRRSRVTARCRELGVALDQATEMSGEGTLPSATD